MSNRQLQENLKKLLGLNTRNEKPANRPRVLGGSSVAKMPASEKAPDICAPPSAMLRFDNQGTPTAKSARIIDGLFDVNTGRQVRIFLDPSAFICENVTTSSEYIWYKLQIKEKLTTRQQTMIGDLDSPVLQGNKWSTYLDVYGIFTMPDNSTMSFLDSNIKQLKILNRTAANAPVFFSTVPLNQQLIEENKDKYKKAVTEIASYFNNNIDGYTGKYVTQRLSKHKTNTCIMETAYVWPPQVADMLNDFNSYLKLDLSGKQDGFCKWVSNADNLFYTTGDKFDYSGGSWYWGINPPDSKDYDSRWRFADDLTYGAVYLLARRNLKLQETGTLQPLNEWYINSYDDAKKGTQFADMAVSLYYRPRYKEDGKTPTTEADYVLQGTIEPEGNKYLWSVDIWPDDAIIEMRFSPITGKFMPLHPLNPELLPNNLNNLSGLNLQDNKDNQYSLTLSNAGFLLTSATAGKSWLIGYDDYILIEK